MTLKECLRDAYNEIKNQHGLCLYHVVFYSGRTTIQAKFSNNDYKKFSTSSSGVDSILKKTYEDALNIHKIKLHSISIDLIPDSIGKMADAQISFEGELL